MSASEAFACLNGLTLLLMIVSFFGGRLYQRQFGHKAHE